MENKYNLPDFCFSNDNVYTDKIIIVKYGEKGYYKTDFTGDSMEYNKKIGVSEAVRMAMVCGSMFGWDVPGVNPKVYDERLKRTQKEEIDR